MKILVALAMLKLFVLGNPLPFDLKSPLAGLNDMMQRHIRQTPNAETIASNLISFGDSNNDGYLSQTELANFLVTHGQMSVTDANAAAEAMINVGDGDGNGLLNSAETLNVAIILVNLQRR